MQTLEELHAHYQAVRARLTGPVKKVEAVRIAPPPKAEPKEERTVIKFTEPTFVNQSDLILYRVADKHRVKVSDIKGQSRKQKYVYARQEAAYHLRFERNLSWTQIGQKLGGRDHTTIIYAIKAHTKRLAERTDTLDEPSVVPAPHAEAQAV
jgi:anion-transporting  ArsA/GET3 family ATPase